MIETWCQFQEFSNSIGNHDLFLYLVPLHDDVHSVINLPSILFIKDLVSNKVYYYGYNHSDIKTPQPEDHSKIINRLNEHSGKKWVINKKSFLHFLFIKNLYDVGLIEYFKQNKLFDIKEFETPAHKLIQRNIKNKFNFGRIVPFVKHLETFSELAESCERIIKDAIKDVIIDESFENFNKHIIEPLSEIEQAGLAIDTNEFKKHFKNQDNVSKMVYTEYNFYTSTGRPSNRFGGINYSALNKDNGCRKSFISRFGSNGKLILIDYTAFHPRIIALLTGYNIPPTTNVYEYLAKLYFNKENPDELDIADAKQITFRQLFGGVEDKYSHIKYLSNLKDFINYHWKFFKDNNYVETPIFKRKITNKHILTSKPATIFNYILQATEGEISIPILGNVNEFLKNKKTKAILYTYDSILFDYNIDDGKITNDIQKIMSLDDKFPTKIYVGDNYHDMRLLE